jgi:hypothetical protein
MAQFLKNVTPSSTEINLFKYSKVLKPLSIRIFSSFFSAIEMRMDFFQSASRSSLCEGSGENEKIPAELNTEDRSTGSSLKKQWKNQRRRK